MSNQENLDFFSRIAAGNAARRSGLEVSPPPEISGREFSPSSLTAGNAEINSYELQVEDFKKQLLGLKEQYKRFLQDYSPNPEKTRKKTVLKDFSFRFETPADNADIRNALDGAGDWEQVQIPHYRGPVGRWTAFYRTVFSYQKLSEGHSFICFTGADYIANVYLNNRYIGSHEGMFAPFAFDITKSLRNGKNTLLVEIKNDYPTLGLDDISIDGDKIYAATGIGWDDPADGWHHCPPGAGIYNTIFLEDRADYFIDDVFIRPDIDKGEIEAWVSLFNATDWNYSDGSLSYTVTVYPYNFKGEPISVSFDQLDKTGPGRNDYRYSIQLPDFVLWEPERPFLYKARVSLYDAGGQLLDQKDTIFGMRKFHMDEDGKDGDKGSLFLNNTPIILRGANDMGHMQVSLINNDFDQIIEDILIAKLANMNFYRFTQRPVQEEIYHYSDMLGMLNQSDLPLFGYLRRGQFTEAVRQAGEMERLIRNHPSCFMVTYINEPFSTTDQHLAHRHLTRPELEDFFDCCNRVVHLENPDRVIKHTEGDYDPPTDNSLSDFHCYNMWYTNHGQPIGKLYKNWIQATKIGWKTGCGEYGTEGLDNYSVMSSRYPVHWLPDSDGTWLPDRIVLAQTNSKHGDWYEEQTGIHNWIKESQRHQAFATTIMTDALRRRSDKIVSTAIHLLIDAWPAGWMKTLVGVDRVPKPSYFAFQRSLKPFRFNWRCDRWKAYAGETVPVEAWLLNDVPLPQENIKIVATIRDDSNLYSSYEIDGRIDAVSARNIAVLQAKLPNVQGRQKIFIDADMYQNDKMIDSERFEIEVFEKPQVAANVQCYGELAEKVASSIGLKIDDTSSVALVSDGSANLDLISKTHSKIAVLFSNSGKDWDYAGKHISCRFVFGGEANDFDCDEGVAFVARDKECPLTKEFEPQDFAYLYNKDKDFIDTTAINVMECIGGELIPFLYSYAKPSFADRVTGNKKRLPVAAKLKDEKDIFFLSLSLNGRTGYNPTLDKLLLNIIHSI